MPSKEELLKYKFVLEVAYDRLGRGLDIDDVKNAISLGIIGYEKMLNYIFNPKPYKFEDLKADMWVWDSKEKVCYQIGIDEDTNEWVYYSFHDGLFDTQFAYPLEFEENRFFPVQCANLGGFRND